MPTAIPYLDNTSLLLPDKFLAPNYRGAADFIYKQTGDTDSTTPLLHFSSNKAVFRAEGNYINYYATEINGSRTNGPVRDRDFELLHQSFISNSEPNTSLIFALAEPKAKEIAEMAASDPSYVLPAQNQRPFLSHNYLRNAVTAGNDRTVYFKNIVIRIHRGTILLINDIDPAKREIVEVKNSNYASNDRFTIDFKFDHAKDTEVFVVRDMCWDLAGDATIIQPKSPSNVQFNVGAMFMGRHSLSGTAGIYPWIRQFGNLEYGGHLGFPYQSAFSSTLSTAKPRITMPSGELKTFDPASGAGAMYATATADSNVNNVVFTLTSTGAAANNFTNIQVNRFVILGTKNQKDYSIVKVTSVTPTTFTANTSMPIPLPDSASPGGTGFRILPVRSSASSTVFSAGATNVAITVLSSEIGYFEVGDWVWLGLPTATGFGFNAKIVSKNTTSNTITINRAATANPGASYDVVPYTTPTTIMQNSNWDFVGDDPALVTFEKNNGTPILTVDTRNDQVLFGRKAVLPPSTTSYPALNIPLGAAPTNPTEGDVWRDTSRVATNIFSAGRNQTLPVVLWTQSVSTPVTNTFVETSLLGNSGIGSRLITPQLLVPGKVFKITAAGSYSQNSFGGNHVHRIKLGTTAIGQVTVALTSGVLSGCFVEIDANMTVRTGGVSGQVAVTGWFRMVAGSTVLASLPFLQTTNIDLSANLTMDITVDPTALDQTYDLVTGVIELKN